MKCYLFVSGSYPHQGSEILEHNGKWTVGPDLPYPVAGGCVVALDDDQVYNTIQTRRYYEHSIFFGRACQHWGPTKHYFCQLWFKIFFSQCSKNLAQNSLLWMTNAYFHLFFFEAAAARKCNIFLDSTPACCREGTFRKWRQHSKHQVSNIDAANTFADQWGSYAYVGTAQKAAYGTKCWPFREGDYKNCFGEGEGKNTS